MKKTPPPLPETITLSQSGLPATVTEDRFTSHSLLFSIGGTPQSHVYVHDPTQLQFEYVRRIGHIIDLLAPPNQPITVLHLGAGALTLPRYVAATRTGSRQQVIEWEPDLVDLVRRHAPWDPTWSIRLRYGDARETLDRLPAGLTGTCNLIVVDLFAGDHTPAHLTTTEFYRALSPLLSPDGCLVVNSVDGPGHSFVRSQWATLSELFGFVGVVGEASVVRGRRFGNLVSISRSDPNPPFWWPDLQRLGPHPTATLSGEKLSSLIRGHTPVTSDSAVDSPQLGRGFSQGSSSQRHCE